MKRYLIRVFSSLSIVALLVVHVLDIYLLPGVDYLEKLLYDMRVRLTAPGGVDDRIVIVAIDEESLEVEGQWPWTRDKLAQMIQQLYVQGVQVVGFDAVFVERDMNHDLETLRELAAGDAQFAERLEQFAPQLNRDRLFGEALSAVPSVLAYYFHTDERVEFAKGELPMPAFDFDDTLEENLFLPRASGYASNPPEIMAGAFSAGFINNPLIDEDGIVRRAPLLHAYDGAAYESLSLALAATYLNDIALPVFVEAPLMLEGYPPLEAIEVAERRIPVDPQGAVLVPYRGGAGSFPYVSSTDVIQGTLSPEERTLLQGAIAILGPTAPGLQDLRSTPFGSIYPGVEIHASVLAGIIDENFRWQPAYTKGAEMLAVVGFGLLMALTLPALSAVYATIMVVFATTLAVWVNMWLWNEKMQVLPLATTLIVLGWAYVLDIVFGYFFESRSRTHMNDLFGQYVPPDLVSEMASDPTNYSMQSEKRDLSVLFTDIRGFTTISEKLDAQELSDLLNRFLTPMTRAVHETHGTIDKYMGDCVMAFWGAPIPDPHHASEAVEAGLRMLENLDELNAEFEEEGLPELHIGVGVNTGTMSVGNMGSVFRRAYTVLGDSVNLGSRLEGLTKAYGVTMLCSDDTKEQAPEFVYREIDRVRVKGKLLPVVIYEVVGREGEVPSQTVANVRQFEQALKLYRNQQWDDALRVLSALKKADPDHLLYDIYTQRIDAFVDEPPPEDWDGVFVHQSK